MHITRTGLDAPVSRGVTKPEAGTMRINGGIHKLVDVCSYRVASS